MIESIAFVATRCTTSYSLNISYWIKIKEITNFVSVAKRDITSRDDESANEQQAKKKLGQTTNQSNKNKALN